MDAESKSKINTWKMILHVEDDPTLEIETALDLPNQRVIKSDVERTRTGILTENERKTLEILLTFYCKEHTTSYKQGMNEIMAPFLLLMRDGLPKEHAYLMFKKFIHTYLPTMFIDSGFRPLQAYFLVFRLVLRYHEPRFSSFLHINGISPELYATSWFITLFANKISDVNLIYKLWEDLVKENDPFFPVYIGIAMLFHFQFQILNSQDQMITQAICEINLETSQDVEEVLHKAAQIKQNMPYSIKSSLRKYDVFNMETIDTLLDTLRKESCLYVSAKEIILKAYPEKCICERDENFCKFCREKARDIPMLVLDCRTEAEQQAGIIPNSALLNPQAYNDSNVMLDIPDAFLCMRGIFHFCLLGSKTFKASSFEFSLQNEHYNADIVQNMVENILQAFLVKGFPYVSIIEGGFELCHGIIKMFNLNLEGHDPNYCLVCSPEGPKIMHRVKSRFKSFTGTIGKLIRSRSPEKNNEKPISENKTEKGENNIRIDPTTAFYVAKRFYKDTRLESEDEYFFWVKDRWLYIGVCGSLDLKNSSKISYVFNILDIEKITSKKRTPKFLTFHFKGFKKRYSFVMKTDLESKKFVNQITSQYQLLFRGPNIIQETLKV
ncbi:TBC1D23_2 [Blepharisma stoltei]|uniref:Rab-GAP TBC domain-containing protein n=1 Tax=Blepharisma stoltei TaxID=1481888 RepID=A0AAU9IH41_9CILI|nr:unnamed protein product [Blepharisma stoltei]